MAVLVSSNTTFLVQGITGRQGNYYTAQMLAFGTKIVGGVSPEKGGDWLHGVPVFDSVRTAIEATGANASIVFVTPSAAVDAIYEAVNAGLELIVCITDGIPIKDTLKLRAYLSRHKRSRLIGPSSPGIFTPHLVSAGIIPGWLAQSGTYGIVTRSTSLAYEVMSMMKAAGIGLTTCVGVGGDPVVGTSLSDVLTLFEEDPETTGIILLGEIGGTSEIEAAAYIGKRLTKRVVAYIAGHSAPVNMRMGHSGAIVTTPITGAAAKCEALRSAGALVANTLDDIVPLLTLGRSLSDQ